MSLAHGTELSERVIGSAIEVHRHLGPGLLESAYEECLCFEIGRAGLGYSHEQALPIIYKDLRLDCGYRIDILIERELIVEIKATERVLPVHEAQILTYLRLSGCRIGLLLNFNAVLLKDGLKRFVL